MASLSSLSFLSSLSSLSFLPFLSFPSFSLSPMKLLTRLRNIIRGTVGLEGDCGVIGVLLPSYTPQMSVVFRLRGVNQYGTSDWVYWKGGKW